MPSLQTESFCLCKTQNNRENTEFAAAAVGIETSTAARTLLSSLGMDFIPNSGTVLESLVPVWHWDQQPLICTWNSLGIQGILLVHLSNFSLTSNPFSSDFPKQTLLFPPVYFHLSGTASSAFFFFSPRHFFWWNQCREQFYINSAHCTALVLMSPVFCLTFILMEGIFPLQQSSSSFLESSFESFVF